MAKVRSGNGAKATDPKINSRQDWKGFVSSEMNDDMKEHFRLWLKNWQDTPLAEILGPLAGTGARISLKANGTGDWCASATMPVYRDGVLLGDYTLTAWRPEPVEAILLLIWKDEQMFARDWSSGVLDQKRFDW